MIKVEGQVYCDHHGCIHDKSFSPYNGPPTTHDADGNPSWLEPRPIMSDGSIGGHYVENWEEAVGHKIMPMKPECRPEDWRVLWAGRTVA